MDLSGNYKANKAGTHCEHCGWAVEAHKPFSCAEAHRLATRPLVETRPEKVKPMFQAKDPHPLPPGWPYVQQVEIVNVRTDGLHNTPIPCERTSPLSDRVGGDHYKSLTIQPVEYIHKNGIGFCEGSVIKYVSRWRAKGGVEDLKKARHFLDLLIEMESKGPTATP